MSIPIDRYFQLPLPGTVYPTGLAFSPDDTNITFLFSPELSLINQLFVYDIQTGSQQPLVVQAGLSEENVTPEETLRRERLRQISLGVTQYAWAEKTDRLLIPFPNALYVLDSLTSPLRILLDSPDHSIQSPQLSPDGEWVAYVQEDELYVVPFQEGQPRPLTHGARGTGKTHGLAEYIAQEEMDRLEGFWWSPDSRWIAFEEVDETHIPVYPIVHQGKALANGAVPQEDHRYPFAGQPNAIARLGIVSIEGGEPIWLDLGPETDIYLARVQWFPDGSLVVQRENRMQTVLDVLKFNPQNGECSLLLQEENKTWINLHNFLKPLGKEAGSGFIWASERSGYRHLYLYDDQGHLVHPLTHGDWLVDSFLGVDARSGFLYFTATLASPLESHLYRAPLSGGEPQRLTEGAGMHSIVIDHGFERFIDTTSDLDHPPTVCLRDLADGALIETIFNQVDARLVELDLQPPRIVSLPNRHGDLLYGALYHPPASFGEGPFPTIISVYGGPHAQMVTRSWPMTITMRAQYLATLGFLVFVLDNRGSARRGLAFESIIKHDLGHLEVEDQVDGVGWLVEQGLADPRRVGIYGWSYGGYMAAMCLAHAPQVFRAAVVGAPVTHWDGYDTHYTERYMGTPQSNPQGYEISSVMAHVPDISGRLLLVHGLIDENVHFRHTARLVNALNQARKPYELLFFPDERHLPRRLADRIYMEERIRDFFLASLSS